LEFDKLNKIPVLLTSFIRPAFIYDILQKLEKRNDIDLFFASDGPRNSYDEKKIDDCLSILKQSKFKINHQNTLINNRNYGTKMGLVKSIDWFFSKNKSGIILEDDCLPDDLLFDVINEGLQKYFNSSRYMTISGCDFLPVNMNQSETFFRESNFPMVWGWGSWSDKWSLYKIDIPDINLVVNKIATKLFGSKISFSKVLFIDIFKKRFSEVEKGRINTWDYSLMATAWRNDLVCLQTNYNMVVNMGFGADAAHTTGEKPHWVPSYFRSKPIQVDIAKIDSRILMYEKWIAKNVYNCNTNEFFKNQVKRSLRI